VPHAEPGPAQVVVVRVIERCGPRRNSSWASVARRDELTLWPRRAGPEPDELDDDDEAAEGRWPVVSSEQIHAAVPVWPPAVEPAKGSTDGTHEVLPPRMVDEDGPLPHAVMLDGCRGEHGEHPRLRVPSHRLRCGTVTELAPRHAGPQQLACACAPEIMCFHVPGSPGWALPAQRSAA